MRIACYTFNKLNILLLYVFILADINMLHSRKLTGTV